MKQISIILILSSASLSPAGSGKPEFAEFTSKEGGFTILFPGTPKQVKVPDKQGGVLQYQFMAGNEDGAYLLSYQDNANLRNATQEGLAKALVKGQEAAQASVKGKLVQAKEITLDKKHPGREYEFETPLGMGGIFRSRAYLVKGRLYQVIVIGKKEFAKSKEADRFLDSFKLTP